MIEEIIADIIRIHEQIEDFWDQGAYGWAPGDASDLLSKSRLDRQTSLAYCLSKWTDEFCSKEADGTLILAWSNLGALVEGTMKWFLCVYNHNYETNPVRNKRGSALDPDDILFYKMTVFFNNNVWVENEKNRWNSFVELVRNRRNAIHSYNDKEIGTFEEFYDSVKEYREFLLVLDGRVPYPQ